MDCVFSCKRQIHNRQKPDFLNFKCSILIRVSAFDSLIMIQTEERCHSSSQSRKLRGHRWSGLCLPTTSEALNVSLRKITEMMALAVERKYKFMLMSLTIKTHCSPAEQTGALYYTVHSESIQTPSIYINRFCLKYHFDTSIHTPVYIIKAAYHSISLEI